MPDDIVLRLEEIEPMPVLHGVEVWLAITDARDEIMRLRKKINRIIDTHDVQEEDYE
jgi:hypothetical protein